MLRMQKWLERCCLWLKDVARGLRDVAGGRKVLCVLRQAVQKWLEGDRLWKQQEGALQVCFPNYR